MTSIHWIIFVAGSSALIAISWKSFHFVTAKADEVECIQFFRSDYLEYMKTTKMFIPYIF